MSFLWSKLFQWQKKNTRYKMPTKDQGLSVGDQGWNHIREAKEKQNLVLRVMLPASAPIATEQEERGKAEGWGDTVPGEQAAVSIHHLVTSSDAHNRLSTCVICVEGFLLYLAVTEKPAPLSRCLFSECWVTTRLPVESAWFFRTPGNRWFLWAFLFSLLNGARALQLTFCSCQLYMKYCPLKVTPSKMQTK